MTMKEQVCRMSPETEMLLQDICQSGKEVELWACDWRESSIDTEDFWQNNAYEFALAQGTHWVQLSLVMPPEGVEELQTFAAQASECLNPLERKELWRGYRGETKELAWQRIGTLSAPISLAVVQDRLEMEHLTLVNDAAIILGTTEGKWVIQHTPIYRIRLTRSEMNMLSSGDSWPWHFEDCVRFEREKRWLVTC